MKQLKDNDLIAEAYLKVSEKYIKESTEPIKEDYLDMEALESAAVWAQKELNIRRYGHHGHISHLIHDILSEADRKFNIGSHGVEGILEDGIDIQYLNMGDTYTPTLLCVDGEQFHSGDWGTFVEEAQAGLEEPEEEYSDYDDDYSDYEEEADEPYFD